MMDGKVSVVVFMGKSRWMVSNQYSHQFEIYCMLLKTFVKKIHPIHELFTSRFPAVSLQETCHSNGIGRSKWVRLVQTLIHFVGIAINHDDDDYERLCTSYSDFRLVCNAAIAYNTCFRWDFVEDVH